MAVLIIIMFAGWKALARYERRFSDISGYGLGTTAMITASILVTVFALTKQVQPDPWFDPRYTIRMLGMLLGNTMTGASLDLHGLPTGAWQNRRGIEARLALGANRWEAMRPVSRAAMANAPIPSINAMSASGIVYLPGMMTG